MERTWYVTRMFLLSAAVVLLGISGFTWRADLVDLSNNFDVVGGFTIILLSVAGVVMYFSWLVGGLQTHLGSKRDGNSLKRVESAGKAKMVAGLVLLGCGATLMGGCTKVPPGYVGVRVKFYGQQRGVQDIPIVTGRVWYDPVTEEIYKFPTFLQYRVWTQNPHEGKAADESITFTSQEGALVNADVSVAYLYEGPKVPSLFLEFREDPDAIADGYIRSRVRDAFVRVASKMRIMDIAGAQLGQLTTAVKNELGTELHPKGIDFDYVSIVGEMRIPEDIRNAINSAVQTTQLAQQAQNKVAQIEAEARQRVADAEGKADAMRAEAKGRADALLMEKDAEAKSNKLIAESLTPEYIQYLALAKWKGDVPTFTGTSSMPIPFLQIPSK